MKITSKSKFAVEAMIYLAINERPGHAVKLAEISESQSISKSYLEQLFMRMKNAGLAVGSRGPNGGYSLARKPELINIAQIIDATEDKLEREVREDPDCCELFAQGLWSGLDDAMRLYLRSISLKDAVDRCRGAKEAEPSEAA